MKQLMTHVRVFTRSFWLTALSLICPLALLLGIWVADTNTRAVAFSTAPAAFSLERSEESMTLNVLGYAITLPDHAVETATTVTKQAAVLLPPQVRLPWELLLRVAPATAELVEQMTETEPETP